MTADHVNVFILYGTETNTTVNAALLLASHVVTWHICHPVAEPSASPEMSATHFRSKNVAPESSRPNCKVLVSELDGFDIWDHWNRINVQNSEGRTHDPYTVYFLLCSTTGQGEAPRTMLNFWKRALRKNVESLKGLPFAVFGLGDSSYEKFNVMAKMVQNRLVQLGANPLVQRGLGDDQDASGYLQTFLPWITELQSVVTGHDTVKTSHTLETVFGGDDHLTNLFEVSIVTVGASGDPAGDVPTPHDSKSQTLASRDDMKRIKYETEGQCYLALRLVERTCLTWSGADEEESPLHRSRDHRVVYHIGFEPIVDPFQCDRTVVPSPLCVEGSDLTWLCGDLLGFLPPNHTDVVEGLLKYFQLDPEKHRVRISMNPQYPIQWQTSGSGQEVFRAGQDVCSPWLTSQNGDGYVIRPDILFRDYLDIEAPATPLLLRDLARYATDPDEQEKLLELSRVDNNSEFYQYVTRERRHPLEVLQDFPSIRGVPLKVLIAHIPWGGITPRWYSLSSASFWTGEGSLSSTEPQRPCFALTVARVQYQTPYGRKRVGLCSDYLCKRAALGDVVHAVLRQNPKITFDATKDRKTPVVFFSTGTGIAPARSMIQARSTIAQQENSYPTHPDILFFGVRSKHGALLYEFEWANKYDARVLDANFAFSRDTPGARVYVQHALRSNGVLARNVAELLTEQNANVFISGGSKNMPRDVMRALAAVLHDVKPEMFPELNGAESYIQTMKRNGRLCVDAW